MKKDKKTFIFAIFLQVMFLLVVVLIMGERRLAETKSTTIFKRF